MWSAAVVVDLGLHCLLSLSIPVPLSDLVSMNMQDTPGPYLFGLTFAFYAIVS